MPRITSVAEPLDHRRRLMEAMAQVAAIHGYAAVTIADLAAEAHVSKRTFYEHFATKDECLIALYDAASQQALAVMKAAVDEHAPWTARVEQALAAYFSTLSSHPVLLHTLFVEILGLGPVGVAARQRAQRALADLLVRTVEANGGPSLTQRQASAIVGGFSEWVLEALQDKRLGKLSELTEPAVQLVRAVARER